MRAKRDQSWIWKPGAALLLLLGLFAWRSGKFHKETPRPLQMNPKEEAGVAAVQATPHSLPVQPDEPLPGESLLKSYGLPATPPTADLQAVADVFSTLTLLIKGGDPFRMGANEEFAAALRGVNRAQLRFVPDDSPVFNAAGQVVDRWGTPLFFHARTHDRIDIRSAGPDRIMWTEDDLHRQSSGQYLAGDRLNPRSLDAAP